MSFGQHIQQALVNILSSKLRSFLAVLGILMGTASVVALISIGQLATKDALDQYTKLGTDLMTINLNEDYEAAKSSENEEFDEDHADALVKYYPDISLIGPYANLYAPTNFGGHTLDSSIIAATEDLKEIIKIEVDKGRFISFLDQFSYHCVIGSKVYEKIKSETNQEPIGKQIQVGSNFFTIVGVMKQWPENSFFFADINGSVIVPIKTRKLLSSYSKIHSVVMKLKETANIDVAKEEIAKFMNSKFPHLSVWYRSAEEIVKTKEKQEQTFTLLLGAIGGISLLVGGIGIMNVMLVSVTERRKEIGIRMAVGAKRNDIRMLFLAESVVLALFGGVIGIIFGVSSSFIMAMISKWTFTIFLAPPMLGFIVSVITGVFFGFYPAHRAAKLDPIQTLRYD